MKTIYIICQGNICRSPMGMFILRNRLKELHLENEYEVKSAALESSTAGEDMYPESKKQLDEHHIPYSTHSAHKLTLSEYLLADYILVMEKYQKIDIKRKMSSAHIEKVHALLEYTSDPRDIDDPFYTRDFAKAYEDVSKGIEGFIQKEILNNK